MKQTAFKRVFFIFALLAFAAAAAVAQTARTAPELGVANLRLGAEETNKAILQTYSPRYDNDAHQPKYIFYNGYGNQVMAVTAYSKERPFLVTVIEVFAVGESYQKTHYQMKETNYFTSESGFFLGARQSATSMIFAVPNVTSPKEVIKKKGQPDADEKDGKARVLRYRFDAVKELNAPDAKMNFGAYTAEYRFVNNKLNRFVIAVNATE